MVNQQKEASGEVKRSEQWLWEKVMTPQLVNDHSKSTCLFPSQTASIFGQFAANSTHLELESGKFGENISINFLRLNSSGISDLRLFLTGFAGVFNSLL